MSRSGYAAALCLTCLAWIAGCGGGAANVISIEIQPSTAQSVDIGGVLNFTAYLANDTANRGVTWSLSGTSCSGTGCGTLTNSQPLSVTYTAPTNIAAGLSVTLTATSVAQSNQTKTATINVVLAPAFSTTSPLATGANGAPYNQTITITGGVAPYTFSVVLGQAALSAACLTLNPGPTSNTSTTLVGTPCNIVTANPAFTVQVSDSGGATPVQQPYTMTLTPPPPLSILTASLPGPVYTNTSYTTTLQAQGGVDPLTWSVVGANPLSSHGLTLYPSGLISGTPTNPGTFNFQVQVQDSSLPAPGQQKQGTISFTVKNPPALSIPPIPPLPAGTVALPYSQSLQANGGVPPYTWSVTQGLLPSGLSLSTNAFGNGIISGTPILATSLTGATFTVQVADSEVVPATATEQLNIVIGSTGATPNSLLQGTYTFLFTGFDADKSSSGSGTACAAGSPLSVVIVGYLVADGKGNITSGEEDSNRCEGINAGTGSAIAIIDTTTNPSTYSIGTDGRGTLELATQTTTGAVVTYDYQLALDSSGNARFFENNSAGKSSDTYGTHGAGILKPVFGSFSAASFSGNYAFVFSGQDSSAKSAALGGVFNANGSGTISQGVGDFNDAGAFTSPVTLSGTFGAISGERALAALTFAAPAQLNLAFVAYFVSPSDLFFAEIDPTDSTHPRIAGEMILQQPSFSFTTTALGGGSIATGTGVDNGNASVFAGLLTAPTCDGTTTATLSYDQNDGGVIAAPAPVVINGTCKIVSNGRATFSGLGASASATRLATAYLTGPAQGFLLGSDTAVTTGLLEQQSGGPFALTSVWGGYTISALFTAETLVDNVVGQLTVDGSGHVTGTLDEFDAPTSSHTEGTPNLDQSLAATLSAPTAGRGTLATSPVVTGFPTSGVFYIVSPSSLRVISTDPTDTHPEVIFLDH